ncbi:MAG: DUF1493 family protein [Saprospiraceae bacterium]|nr:DUF1493 family protein [Saprospiraceae bacterium]
MIKTTEIIRFLEELSGLDYDDIQPHTDIFKDLNIVGDDFHDMIEKFAKLYSVDMSNYPWYFHADEEGFNTGSLFFKPPYQRVKRIPITPEMLTSFANTGSWDFKYPPHEIPKKRYDLLINRLIFGLCLIFMFFILFKKCKS